MNKKDLVPTILIILMIPLWIYVIDPMVAKKFPSKAPIEKSATETPAPESTAPTPTTLVTPDSTPAEALANKIPAIDLPKAEETTAFLENDKLKLELTSLGGGIKSATLFNYPIVKNGTDPVVLDFSDAPALAYEGVEGISALEALQIEPSTDGSSIRFTQKLPETELTFERTISLGEGYLLTVKDRFIATGTVPTTLPENRILTGTMRNPVGVKATRGVSILGVDTLTPSGELEYWGRKL